MGRPATMFFWKNRGFATDAGGRRTVLVKGPRTRANRELGLRKLAAFLEESDQVQKTGICPPLPHLPPKVATIGEIIDLFLADREARIQAGEMKPSTLASFYRPYLSLVRQEFGAIALDSLTRKVIIEYRSRLSDRALQPNTVKNYLDAFRTCLRWAQQNEIIPSGAVPAFPCLPRRRRERLPTDKEVQLLLEASPPDVRDVLETLVNLAVRPGDLFSLTPDVVDLGAGLLYLKDSKTGPRLVCLVPRAAEILGRRLAMETTKCSGFVFTSAHGGRWQHRYFGEKVREVRVRVGLGSHCVAYVLRHVWTTNAFLRGLDLPTVRALRGDRDPRTAWVYEHLANHVGHLRSAARRAVGLPADEGTPNTPPHPQGESGSPQHPAQPGTREADSEQQGCIQSAG
jgi:integrase